jgi:hypothetical protein
MRRYWRTCGSRRRVSVLLCCLLAVAVTARAVAAPAARAAQEPPSELWKQFPLRGQGTVPAETTSGPEKTTPPPERATPGELPSAAGKSNLRSLWIAVGVACLGIGLGSFVWLVRVLWAERRVWATLMPERSRARPKELLGRVFVRQPALAYGRSPRRLSLNLVTFFDSAHERGGGWRLLRRRLRRARPKTDAVTEATPKENEQADEKAAPRSAVELIGIYSSSAASTEVEPTDEEPSPAEHPAASAATPGTEEAAPTAEPLEQESQAWPADHRDALTRMVGDQIATARQTHHALGLVAIEFERTLAEAEPDADQLLDQVDAALSQVLRSTEKPEVVADPEERLVWLALPGLLRRRAVELASHVRPLLSERSLAPAAVAVSAYPRDGATAEELLANCHGKLETSDAHESVAE